MRLNHLKRREFITLLGSAAAWSLAARAQQPSDQTRRIGVLMASAESDREGQTFVAAFREELPKLGWAEGRNIRFYIRWGRSMRRQCNDTRRNSSVCSPTSFSRKAQRSPQRCCNKHTPSPSFSRSLAIRSAAASSRASRGRGGNVTGFTGIEPTLAGKWLELLKEIAPRVTQVALLFNRPTAPYADVFLNPFKAAAASFGVEAIAAPVHDTSELESVVAALAREPNGGLLVWPDSFLNVHRAEVISLAARYRLPAVYALRFFPELGGLLSYGHDMADNFRRAAIYADRILKGAKPSELPVQAPVKFELVINMRTAKALGLDVPSFLQQRADEVIE